MSIIQCLKRPLAPGLTLAIAALISGASGVASPILEGFSNNLNRFTFDSSVSQFVQPMVVTSSGKLPGSIAERTDTVNQILKSNAMVAPLHATDVPNEILMVLRLSKKDMVRAADQDEQVLIYGIADLEKQLIDILSSGNREAYKFHIPASKESDESNGFVIFDLNTWTYLVVRGF